MKHPMFMAVSLALLAALEPPMWHLWTVLNTANANFYYAITLLWGSWQVSCGRTKGPNACWQSGSIAPCVAAVQKHGLGGAHAVKPRNSFSTWCSTAPRQQVVLQVMLLLQLITSAVQQDEHCIAAVPTQRLSAARQKLV